MQLRVERQPNKILQSSSWIRNSIFLTTVLSTDASGCWPSGLVCVLGRYQAGDVLSQFSNSAGRPEATVDLLSRQAFPLFFTSMNRHSILLATPAQPLSHLWFCVCLSTDSWSNQLPNPHSYTSAKVFQSLFFPFHSPVTSLDLMTSYLESRNFLLTSTSLHSPSSLLSCTLLPDEKF